MRYQLPLDWDTNLCEMVSQRWNKCQIWPKWLAVKPLCSTGVCWQIHRSKHLVVNVGEGLYGGAVCVVWSPSQLSFSLLCFSLPAPLQCEASALQLFQLSRSPAVLWNQLETGFQLSFTSETPLVWHELGLAWLLFDSSWLQWEKKYFERTDLLALILWSVNTSPSYSPHLHIWVQSLASLFHSSDTSRWLCMRWEEQPALVPVPTLCSEFPLHLLPPPKPWVYLPYGF